MRVSPSTPFSLNLLIWTLLLSLAAPLAEAQTQEQTPPEAPAADAAAAEQDPEKQIEHIAELRKSLQDERAAVARRLAAVKAKDLTDEAEMLQQQLDLLDRIDTVYAGQIAQWKRNQELETKREQDRQKMARLETPPAEDKAPSFLELDRAREELKVESGRIKAVRAKVDLVKSALEQAQRTLNDKQEQLAGVQNSAENGDVAVQTAQRAVTLAEQQVRLAELELQNEEKAFAAYETHLELLRRQVDFLQQYARFPSKELQPQLERIRKKAFELNRESAQIMERQARSQTLLDQARKRLEAAAFEQTKTLDEEVEARRLELEALKTRHEAVKRKLELLEGRKTAWQRRHDVFNQAVELSQLPDWRSEANSAVERIDQEIDTLNLWLSDWQNRLAAVESKIANLTPETNGTTRWLELQRGQIRSIVDTLQNSVADLEKSRRLYTHLIDDIGIRAARRSLGDWIDLLVNLEFRHNSLLDWVYAATIAVSIFLLLYVLRWLLIRQLKNFAQRDHLSLTNGLLSSVKRANLAVFLIIAVFFASLPLTLAPSTDAALSKVVQVAVALQIAIWASGILRAWVFRILARKTKRDGASMGALSILNFSSQVVLWSVVLLLILQNLGINVTGLMAGLGIGGIAVALSLQRVLTDLFASLSIVLDKPFVIGDFVIFDDILGVIEHIGIKTTRLRSLSGEQIICANGELLNTRIRNYKRMHERRVVFKIGVVYQTPYYKLERIPAMIKEAVEACEKTRFDRAHFFQYGDFSLNFEIVYYVLSPDYNLYMDIQQAINLDLYRRFAKEKIEFAYPTQSVFVQNVANSQLP